MASWSRFRPVPEFIAAVMPTMRSSRSHSATSALPKTVVYCGGAGLALVKFGFLAAAARALAARSACPRPVVFCGGAGLAWVKFGFLAAAAGEPLEIDLGLAACH